jgi:tRNA(Ile)-lysidine synthase
MTQLHYKSILQLAGQDVNGKEISLPRGFIARREREQITLTRSKPVKTGGTPACAAAALQIPGKTRFAGYEIEARILPRGEMSGSQIESDKSRWREYLDLDRVKLPVVVRLRQVGDRFQPLGMTGEKKVGKFLTTAKVPHDLRERILVFADQEKIIWICPVRISEQTKVTGGTLRVLQLNVIHA